MANSFSLLIEKLIRFGVLEKRSQILHFTQEFCSHVALWQAGCQSNSIESWKQMLISFDPHLDAIADGEVVDIIVYLDYYTTIEPESESDPELNVPGSL